MGKVAATIKIMPEDVETDLNELKENIKAVVPEGAEFYTAEEKPIAFGIKALMVIVMVGDLEGGTDTVEEAFSKVPGVESVQVVEVGRPI